MSLRNFMTRRRLLVLLGVLGVLALALVFVGRWLNATKRGGQEPAEPFRIAGNLYYVGANDVAAFLITGPEGHVVLDGGYPTTAPMIMASIAKLGFDIKDVKVLLNSEPHPDHAGGLVVLQQASGAEVWASDASADAITSGGEDPDMMLPLRVLMRIGVLGYPPPRVGHRFKDGATIRVGPVALTAHVTGGHTRGCTSWSFPVRDGDRVLNVVSACSLVVMGGMRYPEQDADFERSFRVLRSLPADIWVSSHARLWGRYRKFSRARRRRTRWTRSSTRRVTAPTSTHTRRNSAEGWCTEIMGSGLVLQHFAARARCVIHNCRRPGNVAIQDLTPEIAYFNPSFFPAANREIDSRMRLRASPAAWRCESRRRSRVDRWVPAPGRISTLSGLPSALWRCRPAGQGWRVVAHTCCPLVRPQDRLA